ncbi:hypothetical protein TWF970_003664 [Orbilia oligospora]|uniref:Uncharacterized protein n=1 Tax=Orbilia oligospora TaxID=2813651 RepID=A0A7C8VFI6_ORBOL|nr:hypothetical protein TWF970_003664 [Orbilia oligospora]
MASDEDDIPQISDLAGECEDLFEDLQSLLSGISDKASRVVQGCQQRFERWASYLGVFAAPQASLDSRLKSTPDIRDLVIQLLLTLKRNIQYGIKFESTRPKLGSILVDNDRTKTEVGEQFEVAQQAVLPMTQAALDGIHGAIDRLHRIGTTIRKSSTSNFLSKGRRLGQNHNDEDEFFKNIASLVISGLYPSISEKFIEQLARSILVRKQRLSYQRKHQRKLEKRYKPQKETVIILEPVPDIELSHVEIQQKLDESSGVETSVPPNDTGTISSKVDAYTATLPSVINSFNFRLHLNEAPRAALGPPSTTSIAHGNPYPSPPKTQPGDKYCQCEWCFVELEVLEDKAQWRRAWRYKILHTDYMVLQPGSTWLQEFLTENGLHEHLSQVHSDEISSKQFDMVTRRNSLSVPRGSTVCPLCAQDVLSLNTENSEMEPGDYGTSTPTVPNKAEKKVAFQVIEVKCSNDTELNTSDSEEEFEEDDQVNHKKVAAHVANHLKSLAFVSLRYFKDDDDDTVSVESQDAALEPSEDRSSSKRRCGDHHFDLDSSLSFEDIPLDERDLNDGLSEGIRSLASDSMIISTIEENIERTDFRPDGEDEPKILDWLTTYDYSKSQASFFKQTQETTGEWLLKSDQYRKWLDDDHQMLFCPGPPGSGKTILASIVINDLSSWLLHSDIGIGYIFFESRRSQDQNVNELLSSLLRQLASCRSTLPSDVRKLHEHYTIRGTRPSNDDIFTTLLSVSREFERTFFIIDALEECLEDNSCRKIFTSRLLQLYNTCNSSVFVTSRTLATITNAFGVGDVVKIRAYEADEGTHLDPSISKSGLPPPTENETPTKWAILIGVDHYISGITRPGMKFHNLKGCVEDVNQTEKYLRTALGVREAQIWRLTATTPSDIQQPAAAVSGNHKGPIEPVETRSQWPTYENIISRLQMITQMAEPNDIVYIHYSGHGARVTTMFEELKGARDFDEAIVPTDICSGERYIRHGEISYLLQKMVKKKLVVTVVLGCCYTVFGNRGNMRNTSLRSIPQIDNVRLDSDFSVLPREELATLWNKFAGGKGRFKFESYPLLEPRGYTVLAACQANEYAMEEQFDNKTQGLLTYFLIDTLRNSPRPQDLTYYRLWSLVAAKVRNHNSQQTVMLGGEADHLFLSPGCLSFSTATITDLQEAEGNTIAKLDVGGLQGLSKGIALGAKASTVYPIRTRGDQ